MKLFECQACGQSLSLEDSHCLRCGRVLGFIPDRIELSALEPVGARQWSPLLALGEVYRFCANDRHDVCNWMVPSESSNAFCPACRLNRTIPDLSQPGHIMYWRALERAKHRLVYGLMRLGLPLTPKFDQPELGLAFDFLAPDESSPWGDPVTTGHTRGLITINVREADDVDRERFRANLAEPYRTLLGHFRHEVGHYYWERLIEGTEMIEPFRAVFGDERIDYAQSLDAHYGPQQQPVTWPTLHISQYAAAHPWEDWAETWAHYLHLLDTVETAYWYGLGIAPKAGRDASLTTIADIDPYGVVDFRDLQRIWFPVIYLGNSLNRSMGQPDLYPFVLTPLVLDKLRFVHQVARGVRHYAVEGVPPPSM
jgi:hypothetical protein